LNDQEPAPGRHRTLEDAQALLMARRAALREARKGQSESLTFGDPPCPDPQLPVASEQPAANSHPYSVNSSSGSLDSGQRSADTGQLITAVSELPQHLGWGSAPLTAALRAAAAREQGSVNSARGSVISAQGSMDGEEGKTERESTEKEAVRESVSLSPSLGLAILRNKKAAGARVWLLLRALDGSGSGVISLERARKALTDGASALCFCGWRQLRNLLAGGEDLFWQVDGQRIWLRSAVRVAHNLGVERFRGRDVAIPTSGLTGGIGTVRANLYAAFHSGRDAGPVSRRTLARESGIAPRTQRHYDRRSGVRKETNYASGPALGSPEAQELAWFHGPASFTWQDRRRGRVEYGPRRLAWQLPNSYHGPHARVGRGRRKRQNKTLAVLLHTGTAGNDRQTEDDVIRRYFADARAASRAYTRENDTDLHTAVYWPSVTAGLWHCLWHPCAPGNGRNQRGQKT
jgi:hypothetical protein